MKKKYLLFWRIAFIIYIILLMIFIVLKYKGSLSELMNRANNIIYSRNLGFWNANFIPFNTVNSYLKSFSNIALENILGNIIAFLPLGFLLPIVSTKQNKFINSMLTCLLIIICIEIFQFITCLGYFDIDDIILNELGCIIGFCINFLCRIILDKKILHTDLLE